MKAQANRLVAVIRPEVLMLRAHGERSTRRAGCIVCQYRDGAREKESLVGLVQWSRGDFFVFRAREVREFACPMFVFFA
jgi:hypothetical protein